MTPRHGSTAGLLLSSEDSSEGVLQWLWPSKAFWVWTWSQRKRQSVLPGHFFSNRFFTMQEIFFFLLCSKRNDSPTHILVAACICSVPLGLIYPNRWSYSWFIIRTIKWAEIKHPTVFFFLTGLISHHEDFTRVLAADFLRRHGRCTIINFSRALNMLLGANHFKLTCNFLTSAASTHKWRFRRSFDPQIHQEEVQ